jgi:hypothetical protein
MKARNIILSGVALLVILVTVNAVTAMTVGVTPSGGEPQVYLLKKTFDICDQNSAGQISGNAPLPGGSVPPSSPPADEGKSGNTGCVDVIGDRLNEYLFTGEQMAMLVAVRDLNGAEDLAGATLQVGGVDRVMCNQIDPASLISTTVGTCQLRVGQTGNCVPYTTAAACNVYATQCEWIGDPIWFGHNVAQDLADQPPAKSAGTTNGFDPGFDKLYQCVLTATAADAGDTQVWVVGKSQSGASGMSVLDNVWFNPAISLDIWTETSGTEGTGTDSAISFPTGALGQTVYSPETLKIKNTADGGVDLVTWLAATDIEAASGTPAKCPDSNIIDVEKYMEYRCKIGTIFNNPWNFTQNPNDKLDCTVDNCQGATPLMPAFLPTPSVLLNGHTAECWFRFTYPTPICVGDFTEGGEVIIYARAI